MHNTFKYVIANEGVDSEQDYSYAGQVNCHYVRETSVFYE